MDVFSQIAQAQTEQEMQRAIDNWFYFGEQSQEVDYVIPHIAEHLSKIKEYSYYLQNMGIEQHVLHHLSNSIDEVERVVAHIQDTVENKKEEVYDNNYEDLDDEELKRMVIDKLHDAIG